MAKAFREPGNTVPIGERMIELKVRFWTDKIVPGSGRVLPRHAWSAGVVRMERNSAHGIIPGRPLVFNSMLDLGAVIERALIAHGIALHSSRRMRRYFVTGNSDSMTGLTFEIGSTYTREVILESLGVSKTRGGNWFTGYNRHKGQFYVFANVGTAGRTGHDYANRWEGKRLRWFGKTQSRLSHPTIKALLHPNAKVHIFWRDNARAPFAYAGLGKPVERNDTVPVEVVWELGH